MNLFACSTGETSFEWQDKGRGYFALYLEKGMKGEAANAQGNVTLGSLANYVHQKVPVVTKNNEGQAQTPYPEFGGAGAADFVLATGKPAIVETQKKSSVEPGAEPVNITASMDVKSNVPGAKVTVNKAPLAGMHFETEIDGDQATFEVIVSAEGYKRSVANVRLVPGKNFVHNVTLTKAAAIAKEPERKDPTPIKSPTKPATASELASRVIEAHGWEAFQKLSSIRLTGSARMTAPDPEELRAYVTTMTPGGNFRLSWLSSEGQIEMGGTAQTSWTKQNGVLLPFEIPGGKALFFPQGVLGAIGGDAERQFHRTVDDGTDGAEAPPTFCPYADADRLDESCDRLRPPVTLLRRRKLTIPSPSGITIRSICMVKRYDLVQGIPDPDDDRRREHRTCGTEKMSVTHTYTKAEANVPLKPGFQRG